MDRFLRIDDVIHFTGLARSTIYARINDGTFPPQVKIGLRSVGWRESEISKWIENPFAFHS